MTHLRSSRRRRLRGTALALLAVLPLNGCYAYSEADRGAIRPGSELRVHLARGAEAATEGLAEDRTMTGLVVESDPSSLTLAVWRSDLRTGTRFAPERQRISLPWSVVEELQARRFSTTRTAILAGIVGGGILLVLNSLFGGRSGGTGSGTGPPGDAS